MENSLLHSLNGATEYYTHNQRKDSPALIAVYHPLRIPFPLGGVKGRFWGYLLPCEYPRDERSYISNSYLSITIHIRYIPIESFRVRL